MSVSLKEYGRLYISIRYANDEAFRKKQDEYTKTHHRIKYMNDPEYREKLKLKSRENYAKKKALKELSKIII